MMRTTLITLFILLSCSTCFGQSSFQEITPGESTLDDVQRVLGEPLRQITNLIAEYPAPDGIAKVEVEGYGPVSRLVNRIEVYFVRPVKRQALMQQFDLPQVAEKKTTVDGKLVEYFGDILLALTYASADPGSGVSHIGYYSRELFEKITGLTTGARRGDVDGPVLNASVETFSSWENLEMCETAWATYCDTWIRQGSSWKGWGVPLTITVNGNSVRVERSDRTGLKALYTGTISGDKIQGTVDFCCDGFGNRSGTWQATIRRN